MGPYRILVSLSSLSSLSSLKALFYFFKKLTWPKPPLKTQNIVRSCPMYKTEFMMRASAIRRMKYG